MKWLDSKLFVQQVDQKSKITSYILQERVAPLQQSFYYINDPSDRHERYLWFYCAFPPSGNAAYGRTLAVVDLQEQSLRHFPETQFQSASPYVDPDTANVFWATGRAIWTRSPEAKSKPQCVYELPAAVINNRETGRMATHLTRSADGQYFAIDAKIGLQYWFGTIPFNGRGDIDVWHRWDRQYNHAQFNPKDPDSILCAQEIHVDPLTGIRSMYDNRLWILKRGCKPKPVFSDPMAVTHEWWDPAGDHICCIRGRDQENPGVWRININSKRIENIWPGEHWHAHQNQTGNYLVSDSVNEASFYRGCASSVKFMNVQTGKEICFARNPAYKNPQGLNYHIDPHPRFVLDDKYVCYTTTVRGVVDLALVRVAELVAATE